MQGVRSRGYLNEEYRLFHSSDRLDMDFEAHCHDFHKIVLCLKGQVTYIMEGNTYYLRAWDILLIPEHQIHRSILRSGEEPYERIILWINDAFLRRFGEKALEDVFEWPYRAKSGLFRPDAGSRALLLEKLQGVERSQASAQSGHALMADTYLLQFLLELGRLLPEEDGAIEAGTVRGDPRLRDMLEYINANLSEDLSVESLSRRFYISPSYLMHAFKRHTGCTVHRYVSQKRLVSASERIRRGEGVLEAASRSGFAEYTTFLKAFRKQYGCAPGEIRG